MKTVIAFLIGALLAGGLVWQLLPNNAGTPTQSAAGDINPDQLVERVRQQNPQFTNSSIRFMRDLSSFGFPGFYEISLAGQGMVVTAEGDYAIVGDLFALATITNLSGEYRNQQIADLAIQEIGSISPNILVSFPANENVPELGTIWVFTDPTCPYCQRLHEQQKQLAAAGVTIEYIPYPRSGLGGGRDYQQLLQITCADNSAQAMHDFKTGASTEHYALVGDTSACTSAVAEGYAMGQRIGISGTPFIIKSTGGVIAGFNSAEAIIQQMRSAN
ncbi:DsbC family protein [Aliidiomarina sp.]|uniref:DsbC family protein n=1 Tax=Aliidiomarina sp. TaxID=1872439 RepID=UPI003A4E1B52